MEQNNCKTSALTNIDFLRTLQVLHLLRKPDLIKTMLQHRSEVTLISKSSMAPDELISFTILLGKVASSIESNNGMENLFQAIFNDVCVDNLNDLILDFFSKNRNSWKSFVRFLKHLMCLLNAIFSLGLTQCYALSYKILKNLDFYIPIHEAAHQICVSDQIKRDVTRWMGVVKRHTSSEEIADDVEKVATVDNEQGSAGAVDDKTAATAEVLLVNANKREASEEIKENPIKVARSEPDLCPVQLSEPIKLKCGHFLTELTQPMLGSLVLHSEDPDVVLSLCRNPCEALLKCGHKCTGTCSECYRGRFHKQCRAPCSVPMLCGHQSQSCDQLSQPCQLQCLYKCPHGSCPLPCAQICTPCAKKCLRNCAHKECGKRCGDICDIFPCDRACDRKLECGHKCVGFCGDPCPPICFACSKLDCSERFVLLNDCDHVVGTSEIEEWCQLMKGQVRSCPECRTPIVTTMRYSDWFKTTQQGFNIEKAKNLGSVEANEKFNRDLDALVQVLREKEEAYALPKIRTVLTLLQYQLLWASIQQSRLYRYQLNTIRTKLAIIENITNIRNVDNFEKYERKFFEQIVVVLEILQREHQFFTVQQSHDVFCESERVLRIAEFSEIQHLRQFYDQKESVGVGNLEQEIRAKLVVPTLFSERVNEEVKGLLDAFREILLPDLDLPDYKNVQINWTWFECPQ